MDLQRGLPEPVLVLRRALRKLQALGPFKNCGYWDAEEDSSAVAAFAIHFILCYSIHSMGKHTLYHLVSFCPLLQAISFV